MPRLGEIILDRNGHPALRVTANHIALNKGHESIHTHDKDGNPALRITCQDGSVGGQDALTVSAEDILVTLVDADNNEHEYTLLQALQTIKNDQDEHGDQVHAIEEKIPADAGPENPLVTQAELKNFSDDAGMRADYCVQNGCIQANAGYPTILSGNRVQLPGGLVFDVPGTRDNPTRTLLTLASPEIISLSKTINSLLVYIVGVSELQQCDKICFSKTKPADDGSTCQIWFDGVEMHFRSTEYGNVWHACRAAIIGELLYTDGSLTRIKTTGWYHILPPTAE